MNTRPAVVPLSREDILCLAEIRRGLALEKKARKPGSARGVSEVALPLAPFLSSRLSDLSLSIPPGLKRHVNGLSPMRNPAEILLIKEMLLPSNKKRDHSFFVLVICWSGGGDGRRMCSPAKGTLARNPAHLPSDAG